MESKAGAAGAAAIAAVAMLMSLVMLVALLIVFDEDDQTCLGDAGTAALSGDAGVSSSSPAATPEAALPGSLPATLALPRLTLQGEQVRNAAIIIGEGKAHGIPPYGWVVALAAALQESGIRNLNYGDRDSQGMFQQRPGSGWGSPEQIRNPHLATQAFYGVSSHTRNRGLTQVRGWESMSVTQAAQAVQVSGFPYAYADDEPAARAVVAKLTGIVTASTSSEGDSGGAGCPAGGAVAQIGDCPASGSPAEKGLTPDALLVLRCGAAAFPKVKTFYGLGGSLDHVDGKAVDLMVSSAFADVHSPEASAYGWKLANWARANHRALGVHYVIFAARIWNVERDKEGWRPYGSITGSDNDTSLHYDHVHISVWGHKGTGLGSPANLAAGKWTAPLPAGSSYVGCGFHGWKPHGRCYGSHTGQDFPVHSGTKVFATDDGVVVRSVALKRGGSYVSYGNLIVIRAKGEAQMEVYYAHLQKRLFPVGATVRAGQLIGLSGHTGHVEPPGEAGAHLHYEIRIKGTPVNPLPILDGKGVKP